MPKCDFNFSEHLFLKHFQTTVFVSNDYWKILLKRQLQSSFFSKALVCFRSSYQRCSMKKGVLRNFAKLAGQHLCQSLFLNKVAGLKETLAQVFPVNFAKFLRTLFLQNTSGRLLLLLQSPLSESFIQESCHQKYEALCNNNSRL